MHHTYFMCTQGPTCPLPESPTDTCAVVQPLYSECHPPDVCEGRTPSRTWPVHKFWGLGSSNYSFRLLFMFKMKYFQDFCSKDTKLTEGFEEDSAFFQYWSFLLAKSCSMRDPSSLTRCQPGLHQWKCQALSARPPGNSLSTGSSGTHHIHFIFIKYTSAWHVKVYC